MSAETARRPGRAALARRRSAKGGATGESAREGSAARTRRETTAPASAAPALPAPAPRPLGLAVRSGLQAGAAVRLDPHAPLSIGADPADDIVLRDAGLGGARARLTRTAEGVSLRAVRGPVSCGDRALEAGGSVDLAPGTRVRFGAVELELFEAPPAPDAPGSRSSETRAAERTAPAPAATAAAPAPTGLGRRVARAGALAAVALGAGAAWLVVAGPAERAAPPGPTVEALLEAPAFASLRVTRPAGIATVDGVLDDREALRELEATLDAADEPWVDRVETDASLATKTLDVLRVNGADAQLLGSEDGRVSVRTALPGSPDLDALVEVALADVPALAALEIENVPPAPPPPAPGRAVDDPGKRVAMVVSTPPAHVVTEDRTRYFVGALLPSGHRIVGIADGLVSLELGDELTELAF